jgi:hypothetical protein
MSTITFLILLSSISFIAYGISYFTSPHMKAEFERFGLAKWGLLTIFLELLGATGLLVGLVYNPILMLASGGLTLLMFFGLLVRVKMRDGIWVSMPAFLFMLINGYIFYHAIT